MTCKFSLLLFVALVAALVLSIIAAPELASPCPRLFYYDSVNDPGTWTGNLVLNSEDDLHGLWIRLIFDIPPKEVIAEGFESVSSGSNEVLIKNRNTVLSGGSPKNVKITVQYDSDKFPKLIGYRLNAKNACPGRTALEADFFKGDKKEKDFLSTILSKIEPTAVKPAFKCGVQVRDSVYPWHSTVFIKGSYICEATLISPSHVLLPAHCVTYRHDDDKIPSDLLTVTLTESQDTFAVANVEVHDGYNHHTLADDIAVLTLKSPVRDNGFVKPICLDAKDILGNKLIIVGNTEPDADLEEASVKVIDEDECAYKVPNLAGLLNDNNFCISYLPESDCIKYSGSGIVSIKDNIATLKGIVTVGPTLQNPSKKQNCTEDTTAIVTDVTNYHKWILRAIS